MEGAGHGEKEWLFVAPNKACRSDQRIKDVFTPCRIGSSGEWVDLMVIEVGGRLCVLEDLSLGLDTPLDTVGADLKRDEGTKGGRAGCLLQEAYQELWKSY